MSKLNHKFSFILLLRSDVKRGIVHLVFLKVHISVVVKLDGF